MVLPAVSGTEPEPRKSPYHGEAVAFDRAHLTKPRENKDMPLAFALAPLIIQEIRGTNPPPTPRQVFFQAGTILLNGNEHAQMTYWWLYETGGTGRGILPRERTMDEPDFKGAAKLLFPRSPLRHPGTMPRNESALLNAQGVRLTLDRNGFPIIYETPWHAGPTRKLYVTVSVEDGARMKFGPPPPGRHHAVERDGTETPDTVVARVIDDSPAVMGPIVYLHAGTQEMATLICRCMPSQAKELAGQGYYELIPERQPPPPSHPPRGLEELLRLAPPSTRARQ